MFVAGPDLKTVDTVYNIQITCHAKIAPQMEKVAPTGVISR